MKAYIGSTEVDEFLKLKGYKSYRDYYNKKLNELEHAVKDAKEELLNINVNLPVMKLNGVDAGIGNARGKVA